MIQPPSRVPRIHLALLAVTAVAVAFRFWTSLCFFPLAEWNNVRLAPAFMLRFGPTPYPGMEGGPLTTWMYGPVPLLGNLPATLALDSVGALLIAGAINLLLVIFPVSWVVFATAAPRPSTMVIDRAWALLLCFALWPNPGLHYIQADNWALAFGLLANAFLWRSQTGSRVQIALAAFCTALAVWSKQTSLGLVAAQLVWLAFAVNWKQSFRYALTCAICGIGLGFIFVAEFGLDGLWLNLVRIPGSLPFIGDVIARIRDLWMHLMAYLLLPVLILIFARRTLWQRNSPWLLPMLTWICLLPMAMASTFKIGGAPNSLNSVLYLLPPAALALAAKLRVLSARTGHAWVAAGVMTILLQQLSFSPVIPLRPLTAQLVEGEALARAFPHRIYFPWHPLLTHFAEHRFYQVEDGLDTRHLAGLEPPEEAIRKHLPPLWSITAIPGWREQGSFKELQPAGAQLGFVGKWSYYFWSRPEKKDAPIDSP